MLNWLKHWCKYWLKDDELSKMSGLIYLSDRLGLILPLGGDIDSLCRVMSFKALWFCNWLQCLDVNSCCMLDSFDLLQIIQQKQETRHPNVNTQLRLVGTTRTL